MGQQRHIVNKQIVEIELPKSVDALAVQHELSAICREQLTPIIDAVLSNRFNGTESENLQIDRLTIDLGTLNIEDFTTAFAEKFEEIVIEAEEANAETNAPTEKSTEPRRTPLRVVSHYLTTGTLPWWAPDTSKTFVNDQLEILLKTPDASFTKMLSQLRLNAGYLARFLHTFSEELVLASLQLVSTVDTLGLQKIKNELLDVLKKNVSQNASAINDSNVASIFWKAVFNQLPIAKDDEALKIACIKQTLFELNIDQKTGAKENTESSFIASLAEKRSTHFSTDTVWQQALEQLSERVNSDQRNDMKESNSSSAIRTLVKKYSAQYQSDPIWQEFFAQVTQLVKSPSFDQVHPNLLVECKQLLVILELTRKNNDNNRTTEAILQPIAKHLQLVQKGMEPVQRSSEPTVMEQLKSHFDDTDFITVQNAGLILFWPFLLRFFENLELIEDKAFRDENARNKAICALEYLCGEADEDVFEGALPLNKILCGAGLEDPIAPFSLTETEKEMAENMLNAVIQRGPHWGNLSIDGFQSSYVRRQGSLRMRDGHWLLQVEKETFDITLEKLPWSIATVKLPWMNEIILVEWN